MVGYRPENRRKIYCPEVYSILEVGGIFFPEMSSNPLITKIDINCVNNPSNHLQDFLGTYSVHPQNLQYYFSE